MSDNFKLIIVHFLNIFVLIIICLKWGMSIVLACE